MLAAQAQLDALAAGAIHVLEIARTALARRDKQDVVAAVGAKAAQLPAQIRREFAAHAGFPGVGDHPTQGWVAGHGVGQAARVAGVGAAQLHHTGGAAALVVASQAVRLALGA